MFSNYYDFYGFGGIIRPPVLHELPEQYFDRCRIVTTSLAPRKIKLYLSVHAVSGEKFSCTAQINQQPPFVLEFTEEDGTFCTELAVPDLELWSPENPAMHTLTLTADEDAITERFGIRMVRAEKTKILVNDKSYPLLGYNRHESHPEFGSAVPPQIMLEDLQILKDMNCNFVRGCHYPQNQEFLDLCDDMGIMVWEEALGWGDGEDHLTDPFFQQKQVEQTELMLKNSMNHPAIIMFGFLNENRSDLPCCRELIGKLSALIRKTDPSRLVTFATCNFHADKALDFVDVISTNLYPGWYGNTFDDVETLHKIKPCLAKIAEILKSSEENRDKPWIISEIGAAALAGCHDRFRGPWSEDYQADYIRQVCEFLKEEPHAMGLALWQFMDCRSYKNSPHLNRARGFNNKGSLDEYRRPKLACAVVKQAFKEIYQIKQDQQ